MRASRTTVLLACLAGLAACSKNVAVSVNVVTVGCPGSPDPFNSDGGVGNSVQFLQFSVTVDGGTVSTQTAAVGSQTLQLPSSLPLGNAQINVLGLTAQTGGTTLASGSSGPFFIPGDGSISSLSLTVFMRPTNAFSFTNSASAPGTCSVMTSPRAYHSQALLPDGNVLIFGGLQYSNNTALPQTVDWTLALAIPPMPVPNTQYLGTAEVYSPQTGEFTAAGAMPAGNDSVPDLRAFTQLIPFSNGGAAMTGGEGADPTGVDPDTIPAFNGGAFSPEPAPGQWVGIRASFHDHGCLAFDTAGHALVANGYEEADAGAVSTTEIAEFFDPTVWPPKNIVVPNLAITPESPTPIATSRADQACSGFDGVAGLFAGLVLEAGGLVMDSAGTSAGIDQDYVLYQFQGGLPDGGANFAPYVFKGAVLGAPLAEPRARAKAAAMIVTVPVDAGVTALGDAVLLTGGITCNPNGGATCAPAFAQGTEGRLANPPFEYFSQDGGFDVGITSELIAFPGDLVNAGTLASSNMQVERIDHCAVALPDGRVVVIGGLSGSTQATFGTTNSAEIYADDPLAVTLPSVQSTPVPNALIQSRAGMACTLLQDGSILVTGGFQAVPGTLQGTTQPVTTLNTAEIFRPLPLVTGLDGG